MTKETKIRGEAIKKYWSKAKKKCPFNDETLQNGYLKGFIDGAAEAMQKDKWHDLRKDPEDLPPEDESVFIAQEYDKYSPDDEIPMIAWYIGGRWMSINEGHEQAIDWKVYAWHKIPGIPEEYK